MVERDQEQMLCQRDQEKPLKSETFHVEKETDCVKLWERNFRDSKPYEQRREVVWWTRHI
jgi:hypothetical protein